MPYNFKGTEIFLLTAFRSILGYRCGPYISKALGFSLLTTEDGFSFILGVDCLALYLEDTDITLLVIFFYCCRRFQFDTWFSAVLDYRLLGLILKRL